MRRRDLSPHVSPWPQYVRMMKQVVGTSVAASLPPVASATLPPGKLHSASTARSKHVLGSTAADRSFLILIAMAEWCTVWSTTTLGSHKTTGDRSRYFLWNVKHLYEL